MQPKLGARVRLLTGGGLRSAALGANYIRAFAGAILRRLLRTTGTAAEFGRALLGARLTVVAACRVTLVAAIRARLFLFFEECTVTAARYIA